jgi:hypothetical protein
MENLESFKMNLQLFAVGDDEDELTNDDLDVVDPDEDDMDEADEEFESSDESEDENEDDADPQEDDEDNQKQTPEENARMKKMRLKAEAEANKKLEAERKEIEARRKEIEAKELRLAEMEKEKEVKASYLTQEKIWEVADEKGISEELAREFLELKAEKELASAKIKMKEDFNLLQAQRSQYKNDQYFDEIDALVQKTMPHNPTLTYDTLYKHFYHDVAKSHIADIEKNAIKRTIANKQDGMKRRGVSTFNGAVIKTDLSPTIKEINNVLGVDSREVSQHKKKNAHRFKT